MIRSYFLYLPICILPVRSIRPHTFKITRLFPPTFTLTSITLTFPINLIIFQLQFIQYTLQIDLTIFAATLKKLRLFPQLPLMIFQLCLNFPKLVIKARILVIQISKTYCNELSDQIVGEGADTDILWLEHFEIVREYYSII